MNERQYLLVKLIEECAEVSQRATKALTFGVYERQTDGPSTNPKPEAKLNNNERLCQEFTDLIAVSELLNEWLAKPLTTTDTIGKNEKKEKIRKYMIYSRSLKTLNPSDDRCPHGVWGGDRCYKCDAYETLA